MDLPYNQNDFCTLTSYIKKCLFQINSWVVPFESKWFKKKSQLYQNYVIKICLKWHLICMFDILLDRSESSVVFFGEELRIDSHATKVKFFKNIILINSLSVSTMFLHIISDHGSQQLLF